jgi:hypothetical protein
MRGKIAILADHARHNPAILKEIAANPDKVASRFNLCAAETRALRSNNFNAVGSSMGVGRSLRASNHDDAYLS